MLYLDGTSVATNQLINDYKINDIWFSIFQPETKNQFTNQLITT